MSDNESASSYEEDFDLDESLESQSGSLGPRPASYKTAPPAPVSINTAPYNPRNDPDALISMRSQSSTFSQGFPDASTATPRSVSFKQQPSVPANHGPTSAPPPISTTSSSAAYSSNFHSPTTPQPPAPLPAQILHLRAAVQTHSTSTNKSALLNSLSLLETALLTQKAASQSALSDRKTAAKEKQRRAEARRARHVSEVALLKQQTSAATSGLKTVTMERDDAREQLGDVQKLHERAAKAVELKAQIVAGLEQANATLTQTGEEKKTANEALRADRESAEVASEKEVGRLTVEVQRVQSLHDALVVVHAQSVDSLKKQLELVQSEIPERQREIIEQEEARLGRWEERLKDGEAKVGLKVAALSERSERERVVLKAEGEEMMRVALAEVDLVKLRFHSSAAEIEKQHAAVRSSFSQQEARLDAKTRRVDADMIALAEQQRAFSEKRMAFEVEKEMLRPNMVELEESKGRLVAQKGEVEVLGKHLQALNNKIKVEDAALEAKEKELENRELLLTERERTLNSNRKEYGRQSVMLNRQLTNLQEARIGVHEQQMGVAGQVGEVKRVLGAVKMLERRVGLTGGEVVLRDQENRGNVYGDVGGARGGVSVKAIEALESAVERAARNLEEISIRSRQTMGEVAVPVERVDTVVAGPAMEREREAEREKVTLTAPKPIERLEFSGAGRERTVRQILGAEQTLTFSKDSELNAQRLRQLQLR